jgi:DNA-binding Lrp family transcriptional regulator
VNDVRPDPPAPTTRSARSGATDRPARAREVEYDETDRALLRLLAANARVPNNVLAQQVGIAPSTCLMRVRRLQSTGAIRGFHAELAPEVLGRPLQAMIVVRLHGHARTRIGEFGGWLAGLPGVLNVYFLAGADDFQVHVAAESPDALRDFVVRNLSASREVAMTETHLIFEHIRTGTVLP